MTFISIITTTLLALLVIGVLLVIIFDDGDSGRKFAWMLVISLLPVIGILLYLMFGINYHHHWFFERRHEKFLRTVKNEADDDLMRVLRGEDEMEDVEPDFQSLARLLANNNSYTVSSGNDVEIMTNGKRKFELLTKDLSEAKDSIHMEYFLFGKDKGSERIKEILMEKARQGVKVRFIHENIANLNIPGSYYNEMRKAGVSVVKFTNPRKHLLNLVTSINYRDHRKIVVIDGRIAYTGGMNIKDRYFLEWRDTHMRITGKAVASLQNSFMNSWLTAGGTLDKPYMHYFPTVKQGPEDRGDYVRQPVPSSIDISGVQPVIHDALLQVVPDEPDAQWELTEMGYVWMANNAKEYIYLQTPYFVPPEVVLHALKSAALRGVDVRLMIPKAADSAYMQPANKSFFTECLEAGIRIYLRGGHFIHSKTFVCDDYLSQIGSANMDYRSFSINYEINTFIFNKEAAVLNKAIFMKDLEESEEVIFKEWVRRPWYDKIMERVMRLFAPLL